jgi:hypothetical protein
LPDTLKAAYSQVFTRHDGIGLTDILYQRHREFIASVPPDLGVLGMAAHLGCGRSVAQRCVLPDLVLVPAPLLDDDLGFLEVVEAGLVKRTSPGAHWESRLCPKRRL